MNIKSLTQSREAGKIVIKGYLCNYAKNFLLPARSFFMSKTYYNRNRPLTQSSEAEKERKLSFKLKREDLL